MRILAIETSCDETAISIVETSGSAPSTSFRVLGNTVLSQVEIHKKYGGVFPALAKREHAKNLVPILRKTLAEAKLSTPPTKVKPLQEKNGKKTLKIGNKSKLSPTKVKPLLGIILEREPGLFEELEKFFTECDEPAIDTIAVTHGPGLEPALWVGVNFAKALALAWNKPLIPINHMEGHLFSAFIHGRKFFIPEIQFPALALLISGGHTEIILVKNWMQYEKIGQTRDDAVGEAFDKVARILELPYPGGPEISKLAEKYDPRPTNHNPQPPIKLPRPMINTDDYDFSFSGLKTAVLYLVKSLDKLTPELKASIAREFEQAATDVLMKKMRRAQEEYNARTIIIGGGVAANKKIRKAFEELTSTLPGVNLYLPELSATGDNALMIAVAGFFRMKQKPEKKLVGTEVVALGNLCIDSRNL